MDGLRNKPKHKPFPKSPYMVKPFPNGRCIKLGWFMKNHPT
jgi:hypothetical protein